MPKQGSSQDISVSAGSRPWFVPDKTLNRPELVQTESLLSALPADVRFGCRKRMKLKGRLCFSTTKFEKAGEMKLTETDGPCSKPQQTSGLHAEKAASLGDKLIVFLLAVEFISAVKLLPMLRSTVILLNRENNKRLLWKFFTSLF